MTRTQAPRVGDRVRIERDETVYPSKGTWPQFRGRVGTVVEINRDRKRPHLTEWGVVFGKVTARTDGRGAFSWSGHEPITWFKVYELALLTSGTASERPSASRSAGGPGPLTQAGRDAIEDVGLSDVDSGADVGELPSHVERTAT